jgi:dolichol-phosphate mannosyltransferase
LDRAKLSSIKALKINRLIRNLKTYLKANMPTMTKFLVVSGSAVIINLLLLFVMVNYLGFNTDIGENIANAVSMELSIIYNFFMSRAITWKDRLREPGSRLLIQLIKFHVTIGITILFRLVLFPILQLAGIHYIINAAIGIAISAVFNYFVYDNLIFKKGV